MDETSPTEQTPQSDPQLDGAVVNWAAKEYLDLEKGVGWFAIMFAVVLAFIAIDVFFLQSWTFSVLVVVMAIAIMVYSRRPPRDLDYSLSPRQGLYIGEKLYHFDEFRSFGVIDDHGHHSIMLIPRKRFSAGVSVYFPEELGEQIVDILGSQLPMEDAKLDPIDIVVRKLRL